VTVKAKLRCLAVTNGPELETRYEEAIMKKKILSVFAAGALALSVSACNTPGERAAGGAVIGGLGGAAVGAAVGGGRGALVGGALGAAGGAVVGANTSGGDPYGCPYGSFQGRDGRIYCR
jgi:osmotically inducible lipoprotein OsmB